jgi:agmatine/peptidylarginine deiminase
MQNQYTLLPEWAEQEAVLLAWPHESTDWAANLDDARATYFALISAINKSKAVVILLCKSDEIDALQVHLSECLAKDAQVLLVNADYNDTWVRDYGFLTVSDNSLNYPLSFEFNGWGKKFDATLDNQVNESLAKLCQQKLIKAPKVLEGGAIEIDENQHLLTTASCLYNPNRNGNMQVDEYQQLFELYLGAKTTTVFNHGHLEGDDTDGHIDTLARFTPLMGIVLQSADNRPHDPHFAELFKLQYEISQTLPKHKIYNLPLPFIVDEDGERLPASYANFLILNKHILLPTYAVAEDDEAIAVVQKAFPNYVVIPINCVSLVQQNGSLHCVSMQVPTNTLKPEIIEKAEQGVSVL